MKEEIALDYKKIDFLYETTTNFFLRDVKVTNNITYSIAPYKYKCQSDTLFELLAAAQYTVGNKHYTMRENRDDYQLIHTISGGATVKYDGKTYKATPNSTILINCKKKHCFSVDGYESWEYCHLHFLTSFPQLLLNHVPTFTREDSNFLSYFEKIKKTIFSLKETESIYCFIFSNAIHQILTSLIETNHFDSLPPTSAIMFKIEDYIHKHYASSISLKELARKFNYSESYLIRLFRHNLGMTPHKYITLYRLEMVQKLIDAGENINNSVLLCGFKSTSSYYYAKKTYLP